MSDHVSDFIRGEIKELKNRETITSISKIIGWNLQKTWRQINGVTPITLDLVEQLEKHNLIKPLRQMFK
jgi:hypothetical protein